MPITVEINRIPFVKEAFLEGEKIGEKTLLRRILESRFGALPEWATQKIAAASTTKLEKWSLQLLDAKTLREALR